MKKSLLVVSAVLALGCGPAFAAPADVTSTSAEDAAAALASSLVAAAQAAETAGLAAGLSGADLQAKISTAIYDAAVVAVNGGASSADIASAIASAKATVGISSDVKLAFGSAETQVAALFKETPGGVSSGTGQGNGVTPPSGAKAPSVGAGYGTKKS